MADEAGRLVLIGRVATAEQPLHLNPRPDRNLRHPHATHKVIDR